MHAEICEQTFENRNGSFASVRLVVMDAPRFEFMSVARWPDDLHPDTAADLEKAIRLGIAQACDSWGASDVRVVLDAVGYDAQRSSQMAFRIAASAAMQQFLGKRRPR